MHQKSWQSTLSHLFFITSLYILAVECVLNSEFEEKSTRRMFRRSSKLNEALPQSDLSQQENQPDLLVFSGENEEYSPGSGLFKEYLSRGLYTCTSKYVQTITKLNALVKEAYDQYSSCQKLMKDTSDAINTDRLDMLEEMLDGWPTE